MSKTVELASIINDPSSSAAEVSAAKRNLDLMIKLSKTVNALVLNSADAAKQKIKIENILKLSEKVSNLKLGEKSDNFVKAFEKAISEGKSLEDAVKIASGDKFTLKELLDCV